MSGAELSKYARRYIQLVQPRSSSDISESLSVPPDESTVSALHASKYLKTDLDTGT